MDFEAAIDHRHDPASSVVLRYRKAFPLSADGASLDRLDELLVRASLGEGVRVVRLFEYRGVEVHLLDESSLMRTRSLKSIDGCVNAALCALEGVSCIVFESGGNTDRYPLSVLPMPIINNDSPYKFHPTQKPVDLMAWLIRSYTDAGQTVLDFAAGSGTTGVAAALEGRQSILIELNPDYAAIADRRINGEFALTA